jgi:hypothetical protein
VTTDVAAADAAAVVADVIATVIADRGERNRTPDIAFDGGEMLDAIASAPFLVVVGAEQEQETAAPSCRSNQRQRRLRRPSRGRAEFSKTPAEPRADAQPEPNPPPAKRRFADHEIAATEPGTEGRTVVEQTTIESRRPKPAGMPFTARRTEPSRRRTRPRARRAGGTAAKRAEPGSAAGWTAAPGFASLQREIVLPHGLGGRSDGVLEWALLKNVLPALATAVLALAAPLSASAQGLIRDAEIEQILAWLR